MNHSKIVALREALGLCHVVRCENMVDPETKKAFIQYNAMSPDELALANGARHLGFKFEEVDEDTNYVCHIEETGETLLYKLLNVIEFDSDRKRMTCIFETPKGEILLTCKGADTILRPRLKKHLQEEAYQKTLNFLDTCSVMGLRTLLYTSKIIPRDEYNNWNYRWAKAELMN